MVHSTHNLSPAQEFLTFILVPVSPPDSCKADVMITQNCFWSLSKKVRYGVREFSRGAVKWRISASSEGMPTISDKDLLIYISSLIIDAKNKGNPYSKRVHINVTDFLKFCKPGQEDFSGNYYTAILGMLRRLAGSLFETTIRRETHEVKEGFSLISEYKITKKGSGREAVLEFEVELSNWIFNALEDFHVLTYDPRYFLLGPLERQVYSYARSFCGTKNGWIKKTAAEIKESVTDQGTVARFKLELKRMERSIPGYIIKYVQSNDKRDCFYIIQADDKWQPDREKIMKHANRIGSPKDGEQVLKLADGLI